jgi:ubiquinol-cytochrome c reductase cytochrome b/c1 subunit
MPDVLSDGQVAYPDGSPEIVAQYSKDVTAFLMWTAEPHLEARKRLGALAIPFLIVLATLFYLTKRMVWRDIE